MVWNGGFRKILVETDFMAMVDVLRRAPNQNQPHYGIIQSCQDFDYAIAYHVYCECNRLANVFIFLLVI
ncbi:hypothetical protein ACOSQ4_004342 [Xanthoceras sorbifolium]